MFYSSVFKYFLLFFFSRPSYYISSNQYSVSFRPVILVHNTVYIEFHSKSTTSYQITAYAPYSTPITSMTHQNSH